MSSEDQGQKPEESGMAKSYSFALRMEREATEREAARLREMAAENQRRIQEQLAIERAIAESSGTSGTGSE